jgi:hypothetical protein
LITRRLLGRFCNNKLNVFKKPLKKNPLMSRGRRKKLPVRTAEILIHPAEVSRLGFVFFKRNALSRSLLRIGEGRQAPWSVGKSYA